jgi:hypothetical protein
MRRRDLAIGLVLTAAVRTARADEPAKQHRIAIVVPAGAAADISDTGNDPIRRREYQAFFEELSRLGDARDKTSPSSGIPARVGARPLPIWLARSSAGTRT